MVDSIFLHPFTMQVIGPTMSGKSEYVKKFINNIDVICNVTFDRILFYYGQWQKGYESGFTLTNTKIEFYEGLPNPSHYSFDNNKKKLICIDDLYKESGESVLDLFTKGCHHKNISVILITQNLFIYQNNKVIVLKLV